jgi:hypothetical protein
MGLAIKFCTKMISSGVSYFFLLGEDSIFVQIQFCSLKISYVYKI